MSAIKVNPEKNHPKKDMGMGLETPLEPAWNAGINIQHPAMLCCENKGFQGLCHERMNERTDERMINERIA